jgi:predicted RND superfamily exporter protein
LLRDLDALIAAQNLQQINPKLKTVFAGSVPQAIEEFQSIKQDIVGTTVLLVSLIVALLYIFFWSFRIILLLATNLVVAVLLTFACAELKIGFLTTQTAFMASLVAGTGINYGVIFISRFIELRRSDARLKDALVRAFDDTKLPTLIAALTTSISFAVLGFSSNQGLAHFGFIGGLGILFSWLVCFVLLPLWVYELESVAHKVHHYQNPLARALKDYGRQFGNLLTDRYILVLVLTGLFSVGMIPGLIALYRNPLEYNFNNIKNIPRAENIKNIKLRERVYAAFPSSLTPSVILGESRDEAAQFCPAVRKIVDETSTDDNVIASCLGYTDLWREFEPVTDARKAAMNALAETLRSKLISHLDEGDFLGRLGRHYSMEVPTEKQLPEILVRRFRERNGQVGHLAFVSPDNSKPLDDARNLISFTEHLEKVRVGSDQRPVSVASDSFILADLLKGIRREGPLLSALAFGGVVVVCASLAGGFSAALLMSFALFMGVFWMFGVQGFLNYKYNFFNFTALPLTFGIGVDYPINLFIRYRKSGYKGYGAVFTGSGMGVLLCSLTTIVGYGTLLTSSSQALSGFGAIAIIGEFTCLTFALLCLPAVIEVARRSSMLSAIRKHLSGSSKSPAV